MSIETSSKLSPTTIGLHWVVAVFMIILLASGVYMEENKAFALYPWHKSFGIVVFFFAAWRLAWRIQNGWLPPVRDYLQWEKLLAKVVHYLLIIGTLLMPLSGFIMSSMGGHGVALFGLELVARNPDPANPDKVIALHAGLAKMGHILHGLGGKILIAALVLHIAGAYKHHLVDKDATLLRMLGR